MAKDHFPLIFLADRPESQGFTSAQTFGATLRTPPRNRRTHADNLIARLNAAWDQSGGTQAVSSASHHGIYLVFAGSPGFDLKIRSLENLKSGIRLLNVRSEGEGEQQRILATVFVPYAQSGYFLRKLKQYAEEDARTPGTAKHKPLIESIDDIQSATVDAFWTDKRAGPPKNDPAWIEAWLSTAQEDAIQLFRQAINRLEIAEHEDQPVLRFPERTVLLIHANRKQLIRLIESTELLAELRAAQEVASFFINLENRDQVKLVQSLLSQTKVEKDTKVSICILDHGVNQGHPLLSPVLDSSDVLTIRAEWGSHDDQGHGTLMAGAAAYGDILTLLQSEGPVHIRHRLESAKILPPPPAKNPKHLWGHMTSQGISRAEIQAPLRQRIICMAVTATETRDRGTPSSWSGAIDQLAAGVDDEKRKRIILISAGNVDDLDWASYPDSNLASEVEDPGQSWNALTVGAFTEKTRIVDAGLKGYVAMAEAGALSPYSTTSLTWDSGKWPIKPEVVFEGGNVAKSPDGRTMAADDLQLLSTAHDISKAHFATFNATSAATAQAARMAAIIQAVYSDAWPETVRGLVVHSANWTAAMQKQFLDAAKKGSYKKLLKTCGYGVPDIERALYCLRNSLTLISQAEMQPFKKKQSTFGSNEMHLYRLPWPREVLLSLAETQVEMRVTLSYFIEPGPGEIGWEDRYRYASHGLRFELNSPGEDQRSFVRRINRQARAEEEGHPGTESPTERWILGSQRNVGSIHSDIWRGRAADLATSNFIAVRPSIGWWRERHHLGRWNRRCRYSLIVSVHTPGEEIDIYTPVAVQVGIKTPVPIPIVVG
jgi:hypothetical protein